MDLLTKENITIEDIQSLIDNGIGESLNMEYKGAGALKKDESSKAKITKSISAFANSDGGVLIYGIHEEDQQPKSISYIDGNIFTNEWLEQIIGNIHRKIKVEIIPVRLNGDLSKTIYVVRIPESPDAPHMASDGKYYRRMNFQVVPMEEYEVRNLYNRRDTAELSLADIYHMRYAGPNDKDNSVHSFELLFSVENNCKVVEKEYKMTFLLENMEGVKLTWEPSETYIITLNTTNINDNKLMCLSTTRMVPVFPNEKLCIMKFKLNINSKHIESNLSRGKLLLTLHHSSGKKELKSDFASIFKKIMVSKNIITEDNKLKTI